MNQDTLKKISKAIESEIEAFGEVMDVSRFRTLQKKLEKFLITDPVTGVMNRWKIQEVLDNEFRIAKKHKSKLCLMMIDIDGFKKINDIHGHIAGDTVLKAVAQNVEWGFECTVGKSRNFGRWGGDEFIYVLPLLTENEIRNPAPEVISSMKDITYDVCQGSPSPVSVSIGATWLCKNDTVKRFFDRADKAMYKAKNSGGSRLEIS